MYYFLSEKSLRFAKFYGIGGTFNSDIKPPFLMVDPERFYRSGEK
jgi:hypothetical protein